MSTILKALRRLEHEKAHEGRPLRDEVAAVPPGAGRRLPWLALGASALALGIGMGVTMVWLSASDEATHVSEPAVAQAPQHTPRRARVTPGAPPRPVLVVPAPEPQAPVVAAPPPGEGMAPEEMAAPEIDAAIAPLVEPAPAPEAAAAETPVAVVRRPPAPAKPKAPRASASAAAIVAESEPEPGSLPPFETKPRAVSEAPAPSAAPRVASAKPVAPPRTSSPETVVRPQMPNVVVSRTIWHPKADRRVAMVALEGGAARELHEGDAIGSLVVSTIEPSGVVFLHDGIELRRRVGAKN